MLAAVSNPSGRMRSRLRRLAFAVVCAAVTGGGAAGSATSAPFAPEHPCKPRGYSAYEYVYSVRGTPPNATVRARKARLICGGPDDSHWYPVGPMRTVHLSATTMVKLDAVNSTTPESATFAEFVKLMRLRSRDRQFAWWGAGFAVQINSAGRITSLTELFHP
jgi:hypothetical protein